MSVREMVRIYHTWDKWESFHYGFFGNTAPDGMTKDEAEQLYFELLSNDNEFGNVLEKVISEWPFSCEHNLTNDKLNRIAWMGQAALAYKYKIPACFRGGYNRLSPEQQQSADNVALTYINKWLDSHGYPLMDAPKAKASDVKQHLY